MMSEVPLKLSRRASRHSRLQNVSRHSRMDDGRTLKPDPESFAPLEIICTTGANDSRIVAKALAPGIPVCFLETALKTPEWYRGTSLIGKRPPLGPCRRPMPGVLGGS